MISRLWTWIIPMVFTVVSFNFYSYGQRSCLYDLNKQAAVAANIQAVSKALGRYKGACFGTIANAPFNNKLINIDVGAICSPTFDKTTKKIRGFHFNPDYSSLPNITHHQVFNPTRHICSFSETISFSQRRNFYSNTKPYVLKRMSIDNIIYNYNAGKEFFPANWKATTLVKELFHALQNPVSIEAHQSRAGVFRVIGKSRNNDFNIGFSIDNNGKVLSAYPTMSHQKNKNPITNRGVIFPVQQSPQVPPLAPNVQNRAYIIPFMKTQNGIKILLGEPHDRKLFLLGGKVDPWEKEYRKAAIRELLEESGMTIDLKGGFGRNLYFIGKHVMGGSHTAIFALDMKKITRFNEVRGNAVNFRGVPNQFKQQYNLNSDQILRLMNANQRKLNHNNRVKHHFKEMRCFHWIDYKNVMAFIASKNGNFSNRSFNNHLLNRCGMTYLSKFKAQLDSFANCL